MGYKIKNTSKRRIGVVTSSGIQTLAPGKTGTYDNCSNAEVLKLVASVTATKDDAKADEGAAKAAAVKTAPNQPAASEGAGQVKPQGGPPVPK